VRIEKGTTGGKVLIEFFSAEDLTHIRDVVAKVDAVARPPAAPQEPLPVDATVEMKPQGEAKATLDDPIGEPQATSNGTGMSAPTPPIGPDHELPAPPTPPQLSAEEQDLYSVKNFTV
jgi:hypothetical protein